MIRALASLLAAAIAAAGPTAAGRAGPAAPAADDAVPVVRQDAPEAPPPEMVRLKGRDDVAALCRALVPAERLRGGGDAVERGEAEARQDAARDAALERRYEILVPGAKLPFAPYDPSERRLALSYRAQLVGARGAARVWAAEARGLPVEVTPEVARRIVDARRAGTLVVAVVFELPDDATCAGGDAAPRRWTVPMEPVSWTYRDGPVALARGGEGSDRPVATAAQGARARVEVGEPVSGPPEAKALVAARAAPLGACYEEALRRAPGLDGVLVAQLGPSAPTLAADSVGDPALAACVARALAGVTAPAPTAIPIRFVLEPPGAEASPAPGR